MLLDVFFLFRRFQKRKTHLVLKTRGGFWVFDQDAVEHRQCFQITSFTASRMLSMHGEALHRVQMPDFLSERVVAGSFSGNALGEPGLEDLVHQVRDFGCFVTDRQELDQIAGLLRISAIVDGRFSLIVDDQTASSSARRGGAQVPVSNVAQPSTISLKRRLSEGVSGLVLG